MKRVSISFREDINFRKIEIADNFFSRFRGLMFRDCLEQEEGLLLKNCSSIHCCFMKFPIDVVYLASNMTVIAKETVYPWKLGSIFDGAKHVLELPVGTSNVIKCGMQAVIRDGE